MSLIDLNRLLGARDNLRSFVAKFASDRRNLDTLKSAYNGAQKFLFADYVDVVDLLGRVAQTSAGKDYSDSLERSIEDLKSIDPRIDDRVFSVLSVEASVASRTSYGGTAPERVREQIAAAKAELRL